MTQDSDLHRDLVHLLVGTAKAHHEATGGANPEWALWYAERIADEANRLLGSDRTTEDWAHWLVDADERYRSAQQELSWPRAYATWAITEFGG